MTAMGSLKSDECSAFLFTASIAIYGFRIQLHSEFHERIAIISNIYFTTLTCSIMSRT